MIDRRTRLGGHHVQDAYLSLRHRHQISPVRRLEDLLDRPIGKRWGDRLPGRHLPDSYLLLARARRPPRRRRPL